MAKAIAKYIRMSPRKLRRVVNEIRGKDTSSAQVILKFMPYSAARVVEKVLKSAVANAKQNEKLNPEQLKITKACVDQSTTLKRWRAMSRGRGYSIFKRTSHVTLEVSEDESIAALKEFTPKAKQTTTHVHDHNDHEHTHDHIHEEEEPKKTQKSSPAPIKKKSKGKKGNKDK